VIPVLIINLERDQSRRNAIAARLDSLGIPHTFHKAVDGRTLSPEDVARNSPKSELAFARALMPNEVAAGMSHLAAIAEGLRTGADYFCVLEDDVIPAPRLAEALDETALKSLPAFDALRLFAHADRWGKPSKTVAGLAGSVVVRMLRPGWGCAGQIYSRQGAQKITSTIRFVTAPIDFAVYHDCQVEGLRVLETRPPFVDHTPVPSSVGARDSLPDAPRVRLARNASRGLRKIRAARSFVRAWGVREFLSFFPTLR
jgi:GR25 family glycosyltransferase involved in LPS biosynthesis